jgi:alkyl hydroperoxide reductase subunit AhpF
MSLAAAQAVPDKYFAFPVRAAFRRFIVMARLLKESVEKQIREVFAGLKEPVHIIFFGAQEGCEYCADTRQLAEEVAALSDKLSLESRDLQVDAETARQYNVVKTPALVITAKDGETITDYGVRLLGIPSGHEFTSFIQDILLVSSRDSGLTPATREFLKTNNKPIRLQVFVTPT